MAGKKIKNMEEFAKVSGISRPTLSKFFNDPGSVRKSTRGKIEAALEEYDYRPNIFAINQNRKLTKTIGIVVPYLADPFFAEMVRKIENHCIDAGFWPVVFSAHGQQDLEINALATLHSLRPGGALIAPLGRRTDFESIRRYLCRTGEPPCFFEMPPVNPNANKRRDAYIRSMEALGYDPQIVQVGGSGWEFERIGLEEGMRLISSRSLPSETVLCSNDRLAVGLIAAAYQKGLRVGHGAGCAMRIAGHDDHPWSQFTCPPLTTVSQDYAAIAERSVGMLFELMNGEAAKKDRPEILFDGKLVLRSSA